MKDLNQVMRPSTWDDVIGQSDIKEICCKSLAEHKFPKFSIFYGPTGVGKSCIAELIAKEITGSTGDISNSPYIKKYNMAVMVGKKDIVEVIDNIFKFKSSGDAVVYILEEVQVLRQKEEQTPFLEELTKIPDNVYIMMCTTKVTALTPELRNRAILFQLSIPTYEECSRFIDRITDKLGYAPMSSAAKQVLIKSSNYTPRSIVKHIELLASGNAISDTDVNKFFKAISSRAYIDMLSALVDKDVSLYMFTKIAKDILADYNASSFIYGLRDFVIQLLLQAATGSMDFPLTQDEKLLCTELLSKFNESLFATVFDALSRTGMYRSESANDALAILIRLKLQLSKKDTGTILADNARDVTIASLNNAKLSHQKAQQAGKTSQFIESITADSDLSTFGIEDNTIYEES